MSWSKTVTFFHEAWLCDCGATIPEGSDCICCKAKEPTEDADLDERHTDQIVWEFPAHNEVCDDCGGKGSTYLGWAAHEQPSFSLEDFHEEGPDFTEDYFSGYYDRVCPCCKGKRVVLVINEDRIPKAHKVIWEAYLDHLEDERYYRAECEAERRMGC